MKHGDSTNTIKNDRFPASLFLIYLGVMLLMSGFHTGIIVGMNVLEWNKILQIILPILYWSLAAIALTIFTRRVIRKSYEKPMHDLADATKRVAEGDFSVYVPTIHTADRLDYLDVMILDFNKMVEELGSIETLKTDFFSNVSHELKTPLAIIQNNAELLCMEKNPDKQKEYAQVIFDTTKRLSEMISNILKLNKLEKQTILPVAEEYDICEQLAECALYFEPVWEKKEIEFSADMEDSVKIIADASLLELIWNNLISNAVKFTEPGGRILLAEKSTEDLIEVSVEDTGCGMSEETRKHIFEKFYQGDTSHATAGNGLGLSLAMRVAQLNGYQIKVDSDLGRGSRFTVLIPRNGGYNARI